VHVVMQPVHYVALASVSSAPPYASWATAATNIQHAVDAAEAGATVLVSNGVYGTGGWLVYGSMTNRLAVTKPLIVRSANGAGVTIIQGHQVPGTTNGDSAIRCVYLADGAVLEGFTLTNGATHAAGDLYQERSGGGVWCASLSAVVSNCILTGNSAQNGGGGACYGSVANCILTGNSASSYGGAVYSATLNHCTLATNSASQQGGGSYSGTLENCTLMGNRAPSGGGTYSSTLANCTLTGNLASSGGGAYSATLNNCILTGNSASSQGGGTYSSTLANCALAFNSALNGGGTYADSLTNCTIIGNSAASSGGGAHSSTLNNCIIYFNSAPIDPVGTNYSGGTLNHCCAAPLPDSGVGNLAADPQLAGPWHLSAGSPCRGAGTAGFAAGLDLDGEPWTNPPSIGCDEFWAGAATGPLGVSVHAPYTNVAAGFMANFVGNVTGNVSASAWDFGDGTVVSNRPYASHAWATAGEYPVVLRAYNDSYPAGVTATILVHVVMQPVHYVALASVSSAPPYASWATAATNIQDAVDAAATAGATVLVSNGVYGVGGRVVYGSMTNRLAVTKPVIVRSANGAAVTVIQGHQVSGNSAVRCVYLTNGAVLEGFTLTNGATRAAGDLYQERSGGGVWCASLSAVVSHCVIAGNSANKNGGGACYGTVANCTLTGNSASSYGGAAFSATVNNCALAGNSALSAGGAYSSTLNNCILTSNVVTGMYSGGGGAGGGTLNNCVLAGNSAPYGGGGAASATLNNCTVTGNSASQYGGGTYYSTVNNCIVYDNKAPSGSNYFAGTCSYCCTMPSPDTGPGNFTNAPLLVDPAGGNLRLRPDSPCINAGHNAHAPPGLDLDGKPRIAGGTVDMGALEFQSPASAISYAWLQLYGLPTDGSADFADADGDGMNNWQEWRCGTVPTNMASVFRFTSISNDSSGVVLTWSSTFDMAYCVERATNLAGPPSFSPLATNLYSFADTRSYTDSTATNGGACFYRVRLQD
jgi:parallel beta-helix repeat protein